MQDPETFEQRQHARRDAMRQRRSQTETRTPPNPPDPGTIGAPTQALIDSIFRAAPVGIGLVSNRMLGEANDRLCEMVGYSREELLGSSARMLYPTDEDYEYVGTEKYRQIQEHGTGTVETRWRRKDGAIIDVLLSSTPLDLTDLAQGVTFTALDITARKQAKDELQSIFDLSLDMVCIARLQTATFTKVNPAFRTILGYDEQELLERPFLDFVHPDDVERTRATIEEELKRGKSVINFENRFRCRDGSYRWFSWTSHPRPDRDLTYAVAHDITDRKRAAASLEKSEKQYRETALLLETLLDAIPDIIGVQDDQHRILRYNAAGYAFFNMSRHDIEGSKCYELMGENAPCSTCATNTVYETKQPAHVEKYLEEMDRWLDVRAYPILDDDGQIVNIIEHLRDITDRKRAEQALRESEATLNETGMIARIGGWKHDLATGRGTWTKALYDIIEFEPGPPPGVNEHLSYYPPEDRLVLEEAYRRAVEEGEPFDLELRVHTAKGRPLWCRVIGRPVIQDGKCVEMQGTFQDITEKRKTEQALRESEERYRLLFDSADVLVSVYDYEGVCQLMNPKVAALFGGEPDDFIGKSFHELHPQTADEYIRRIRRAIDSGASLEYEDEVEFPGGARWLLSRVHPVPDAQGIFQTAQILSQDITERKRAEAERTRLTAIIEATTDLVSTSTPDGQIDYINRAGLKILGLPQDESTLPERIPDIHPDWAYERVRDEGIPQAVQHGVWEGETAVRRSDGQEIPVSQVIMSHKAPDGTLNYLSTVMRDLSPQKQAETALRESEARFRELAEMLPQIVFETSIDGSVTFGNRAGAEAFGYSQDELACFNVLQLFAPEDRDRIQGNIHKRLVDEKVDNREYRALRKDGTTFPTRIYASAILQEGRPVGLRGIAVDITEEKQIEDERQAHLWSLECMERINGVIREAADPEQMLADVIDTVYSIFETDRVWLLYPCNPDAPSFRVPVERYRPEYPGAHAMDLEVTMSPDHAEDMRIALSSEAPQIRTAGTESPVTEDTAARFGVQAQIFTAVYPKVGQPWLFGMHQCSYARTWTANERDLFKAIARRISDGLSSLLSLRNLRESETRFRELAEMLPQTVFEMDTAGRFTFANQAALETFGYDRAAFEQLTAPQLFAPEERDRVAEGIAKQLRGELVDTHEYQARRQDGQAFPMLLYASPILREGEPVGLRGIGLDITERKQAEAERQAHLWSLECMERINKVIRHATDPEAMLSDVVETVGSIFECDRAWLLYPCDPDAPSFQVPVEHARPEYPGASALGIEIPMEGGTAAICRELLASEDPVTHGPDTPAPVDRDLQRQFGILSEVIMAVHPKIGKPWAFGMHQCSHARAWTPQEQALFKEIGHRIADGLSSLLSVRELRESEGRFRELAELLPQSVFELDAEGRFTYANHLASGTFGYSPDEIKGLHPTDLIAPQDRERITQNIVKRLRGEPFWDHEYTAQRKDGTTFPILVYSAPIIREGRPVGLRSVVVDFTERQHAEQALQESKAKLESILESSPYAITVTTVEGTIVDCNQATLETHGYTSKDDLLGRSAFDFISEGDRARAAEDMQTTLTQGSVRNVEYTLLKNDNQEFPAELSASLMRDSAGEPIGLVAVTVDITERKRIAQALQQSEQKFRSLVETSSDWIWETDAQMRYTYSSPKARDLLGYESDEILGRTPMDLMPPDEAENVAGIVNTCRKGSIPISGLINTCLRRDGTEVVLETNGIPLFDASGQFLGYRGIDRDITERVRAEQAVRESEKRYRELYEGSRDASVAVTMDGRIVDCNSAYLEMLGYRKEELCRMRFQDITPPQWHEPERKILDEQVMTRGYSDIYEKEYRRKDGTVFPIELRAYLSRDRDGRPTGMWALVRDITDRKLAEQALRESERTLMTLMGNLPGIAYRCKNVPEWTMEFMSEGCLNLTEYPPAELIGEGSRPYGDLIRPNERAYVWEQIQRSLKEKTRFELEYRIITRSGQEKWVWERGTGIYREDGALVALEGFISDIDERKKAEGKLLAYQKKLKSLASELALAEERERRRLAADLHDHACQSLALSKMKLQSLLQKADAPETPMLQSICETLTDTIESVRGLTFDLSSPTLYRFGLEAALEELLRDKLTAEHHIAYRFSDDEAPKPLAHDVLVLLYQSVRELLINVIKHSQAREVTLDITRRRDSIRIVLADDGVGFDVDEVLSFPSQRRSVGLFNTLERLDYIGGKLEMESHRGRGSRFTLVAPLEAPTKVAKENDNGSEDSTR